MKSTRLITLALLLSLLFSCKSQITPQITLRSASWHTWTGGQPGVGGMRYYFVLDNKEEAPFTLQQVTIEDQVFIQNQVFVEGDSIRIITSETIAREEPTVNNPNPKQGKLRSTAPTSASVEGMIKNEKVLIEVDTFTKTKPVSYQ